MTKIPPFGCDVRKASDEEKREFLELLDRYENNEYEDLKGSLAYYGIDTDQDVVMFDDEKPALLWFTRIIPIEQGIAILKGEEELKNDGWISVKDRLPELHSLGMSLDVLTIAGIKMSVKSYDWELGRWNGSPHVTVTHWMPLPNPPKQ